LGKLGEEFISVLGKSGMGGALVRDMKTGLPIKVHPKIKDMFPPKKIRITLLKP